MNSLQITDYFWQLNTQLVLSGDIETWWSVVTCKRDKRPNGNAGKVKLENSARCPGSKEGGSFVVDFVLKEFLLFVLFIALSPPPAHFYLKTRNTTGLHTSLFLNMFDLHSSLTVFTAYKQYVTYNRLCESPFSVSCWYYISTDLNQIWIL